MNSTYNASGLPVVLQVSNASMAIGMDEITWKKHCTRANRRLWGTDLQTKYTISCLNFNQLRKDDYYKRTLQIQAEMGALICISRISEATFYLQHWNICQEKFKNQIQYLCVRI